MPWRAVHGLVLAGALLGGLVLSLLVGALVGRYEVSVALIWPPWAVLVVEGWYSRLGPHQRPVSLSLARAMAGTIVVVALWELFAYVLDNRLAIVPLGDVWAAFVDLVSSGLLWTHLAVSAQEFALGYGLAAVVGIGAGLLLATNARFADYVDPWLSFLYAVPLVAIAPLIIVVLGIGIVGKVVVVFLVVVFVVIVNTQVGVRSTDPQLIEAARSFSATRWTIFRRVLLPAALPFIVAGLRLGVARGLVGVVVAELFGARAGLGYLIQTSAQVFRTAHLLVGVLVLAIAGYVGVELLKYVERRLAPYRNFEYRD